ncbi:hypothetical protein D3C77_756460 [compost metagenome]
MIVNKELMELIEEISREAGISFSEACKIAVREINEYHREKNDPLQFLVPHHLSAAKNHALPALSVTRTRGLEL